MMHNHTIFHTIFPIPANPRAFVLLACFVFLPLLFIGSPLQGGEKKNSSVAYSVEIKNPRVKSGATVPLSVTLTPVRGIHINLTPPPEIRIDSSDVIASTGTLQLHKPLKDGYLDPSKPVTLPLTLARELSPGKKTIRGTIIYFYCSEKDGWCSRFKQKFEVQLTIVK